MKYIYFTYIVVSFSFERCYRGLNTVFLSASVSKKNKDGQTREQDYSSESHYRIVSPTFQYKMSHQRVGKCIIINNKNFDEKTGRASMYPAHCTPRSI